ncbi:unnamed protein product, partial [marine sediment metagenome]
MKFAKNNLNEINSEGDLNISPHRKAWTKDQIDASINNNWAGDGQ